MTAAEELALEIFLLGAVQYETETARTGLAVARAHRRLVMRYRRVRLDRKRGFYLLREWDGLLLACRILAEGFDHLPGWDESWRVSL